MKHLLTRTLSVLLFVVMLLCLLPAASATGSVSYFLVIKDGRLLNASTNLDVSAEYASVLSRQSDGSWLLNGLNFVTTNHYGLFIEDNATLVLKSGSVNTISSGNATNGESAIGIAYKGALTIQGNGRLNVNAGTSTTNAFGITNTSDNTNALTIKGGAELHVSTAPANSTSGASIALHNSKSLLCIDNATVYANSNSAYISNAVAAARLVVTGTADAHARLIAQSAQAGSSSAAVSVVQNGLYSGIEVQYADLTLTSGDAGTNSFGLCCDSSVELLDSTVSGTLGSSNLGSFLNATSTLLANRCTLSMNGSAPQNSYAITAKDGLTLIGCSLSLSAAADCINVSGGTANGFVTVTDCTGTLNAQSRYAIFAKGPLSMTESDLTLTASVIGIYTQSLTVDGGQLSIPSVSNMAIYAKDALVLSGGVEILQPSNGVIAKCNATDGSTFYTVMSGASPATAVSFGSCEHVWDAGNVSTQPTCTKDGVKIFTCTVCGRTKQETIAATGHSVVTDAAVAATCTTPGKTEGSHCAVCNAILSAQSVTMPLGHIDADKNGKCDRCGQSYTFVNPFVDLQSGYYYDAVLWAASQNITSGTDPTHFSPDGSCNRGQVVTFLWRAMGEPEPTSSASKFVDCTNPKVFYYKAVLWASENNITQGVDATHFAPSATVTRAQFVTFLWRALKEPVPVSTSSKFVDCANTNAYYYKAVLWAVENNVTTGEDATHFAPDKFCLRKQVVTFLWRALCK